MERIRFTNATVIDVEAGAKPGATITVSGNRISEVRFDRTAPHAEDVRVIDLEGHCVLPGLINCHYHASYKDIGAGGGLAIPIGLETSPGLQVLRAADHVRRALTSGFTSVVSAGGPHAIDGALQAAIAEGLIRGPRIMAGSRDIGSTGHFQHAIPWYWKMEELPGIALCDSPDEVRKAIREEVRRGAEIIKLFLTCGHPESPLKSTMEFSRAELATAIEEAHARGVKIRAHIARRDAIITALELGIDVVDHGDGLDERCIDLLAEKDAYLAPSVMFTHMITQGLEDVYARATRDGVEAMLKLLPIANKAGVKLVLGDDFGAGPLQHGRYGEELAFYVEHAGIPPIDVLRWATRNGAALMGLGDELGEIRPGFLADLVVVAGNPLEDIRLLSKQDAIVAVMKDGKFEKNELVPRPSPGTH